MDTSMTFQEAYGEMPKWLWKKVKEFNVSPADYQELELKYGPRRFSDYGWAIEAFSKNGMFQPYLMWLGR